MAAQPLPIPSPDSVPKPQSPLKRLRQQKSVRIVEKFLLLPLIGAVIAAMIIGRIVDTFIGPKNYLVYVVGDDNDNSYAELMNAALGGDFKYKIGGITVTTDRMPDYGDPQRASSNAESLRGRNDVLMIIGHGSSTSTQSAMPKYLEANPPIPVILTTETNPALYTPPARDEDRVPPVFRLFPTDDDQAETAAKFIAAKGAKSVWVVEDTSNPTYSQYLARTFVKDVYASEPPPKVVLWSTNLNLPPYAVDKLGIDWVFFAGGWQNALVLIRQLKVMQGTKTPKVLLSDASADNSLLTYGGVDVEGVYLLHPLSADAFREHGYSGTGKEAYDLVTALLEDVHTRFNELATDESPIGFRVRRWLGLHRIGDARRATAHYMAIAVHNQLPFTLPDHNTITMKQDQHRAVVRKDAPFHVWQIEHKSGSSKEEFVDPH